MCPVVLFPLFWLFLFFICLEISVFSLILYILSHFSVPFLDPVGPMDRYLSIVNGPFIPTFLLFLMIVSCGAFANPFRLGLFFQSSWPPRFSDLQLCTAPFSFDANLSVFLLGMCSLPYPGLHERQASGLPEGRLPFRRC